MTTTTIFNSKNCGYFAFFLVSSTGQRQYILFIKSFVSLIPKIYYNFSRMSYNTENFDQRGSMFFSIIILFHLSHSTNLSFASRLVINLVSVNRRRIRCRKQSHMAFVCVGTRLQERWIKGRLVRATDQKKRRAQWRKTFIFGAKSRRLDFALRKYTNYMRFCFHSLSITPI